MPLFLYGTLRHLPLLTEVLGGPPRDLTPARLAGHAVRWAEGQSFPLLVEEPGGEARGLLLDAPDTGALDYYEAAFGYVRRPVTVETGVGAVAAEVYLPEDLRWIPGDPWQLDDWVPRWAAISQRAAEEILSRRGVEPPDVAGRGFGTTRMRAASWVRAQSDSAPPGLRAGLSADQVETQTRDRPYRDFFMVEEHHLRFPRFDGTPSETVKRAALVSADAVTVLPYDPDRDRVMVIEQFRYAPFVRGDRHPWSLEPIAGRIDPGETPEQAVRRESAEEAGLTLRDLTLIARYYPSPGALTEYIYSYVGLADLPDDAGGLGGLDSEAEDIRSHVLSFDDAMALLASGEADDAPLILTLQWLAMHRGRFRPGA